MFWSIVPFLFFLALDGAVFRTGWYDHYVEPSSTTAQVEYRLFWLRHAKRSAIPNVLVLGDSRVAEGFSSRAARAAAGGGLEFTNFGMPGSTPRVWYYTIRDADPNRDRFAAVVIPFDHFSDEDSKEISQNRAADVNYVIGRLRINDCWEFSRSFEDRDLRQRLLGDCLIKGAPHSAPMCSNSWPTPRDAPPVRKSGAITEVAISKTMAENLRR